jgi:N-acetylneuraminate lyase
MDHIEGLMAVPLSPLHADGRLNVEIVPACANFLARSGVIGAFVNGTTGEGVLLTSQERCAVTQRWVCRCRRCRGKASGPFKNN